MLLRDVPVSWTSIEVSTLVRQDSPVLSLDGDAWGIVLHYTSILSLFLYFSNNHSCPQVLTLITFVTLQMMIFHPVQEVNLLKQST